MQKGILHIIIFLFITSFSSGVMAQGPLQLTGNDVITIMDANTSNGSPFDGTITGGDGITAESITFSGAIQGKPTFTLKNVATRNLIVEDGADVIIVLDGGNEKNDLGKIENNGKLFFKGDIFMVADKGVTNNAFLTDSTASIQVVNGPANLIMGMAEGNEVHNAKEALISGIVALDERLDQVTFIWQRREALWWADLDTLIVPGGRVIECLYDVDRSGTYRFRAIVEKGDVQTSLISAQKAVVTMTYDVILPEVEGVNTDPVADTYVVNYGDKFNFWLGLKPDYNKSEPVVTTSRGDTLELNMDGLYSIKSITDSLAIRIDGVKPNNPTSNESIFADGIEVKVGEGQIEIDTPETTHLQVITPDGIIRRNQRLTAGNHLITLSPGIYFLKFDKKTVKVLVK